MMTWAAREQNKQLRQLVREIKLWAEAERHRDVTPALERVARMLEKILDGPREP